MQDSPLPAAHFCPGRCREQPKMPHPAPLAQGTFLGPEQLSALLDSVQELLTILSPDGTVQFASAGFTRILGHTSEGLVGRSILDLVHVNDVDRTRKGLRDLTIGRDGKLGGRCRLRSKDGSWRW